MFELPEESLAFEAPQTADHSLDVLPLRRRCAKKSVLEQLDVDSVTGPGYLHRS